MYRFLKLFEFAQEKLPSQILFLRLMQTTDFMSLFCIRSFVYLYTKSYDLRKSQTFYLLTIFWKLFDFSPTVQILRLSDRIQPRNPVLGIFSAEAAATFQLRKIIVAFGKSVF